MQPVDACPAVLPGGDVDVRRDVLVGGEVQRVHPVPVNQAVIQEDIEAIGAMGEGLPVELIEGLHAQSEGAGDPDRLPIGRTPSEALPGAFGHCSADREHPNGAELRRNVIMGHPLPDQRPVQGIDGPLRALVPNLVVEMGAEAPAGISTPPDGVASVEAEGRGGRSVKGPALIRILGFAQPGLDVGMEARQVGVDRRQAPAVQVQGESVSGIGDLDPADAPGLRGEHGHSLYTTGPDVHAGVEVTGSDFAEVAAEPQGDGQRGMQGVLGCQESGNEQNPPQTKPTAADPPAISVHTPSHVRKLPTGLQPPSCAT